MAELFNNNAKSTLASNITNSATSLTVQPGDGVKFPSPTGADFFWLTLDDGTNIEVTQCTARSTDVFTIVRAQQGSSAAAFNATITRVEQRLTKQSLERIFPRASLFYDFINDFIGVTTAGGLANSSNGTGSGNNEIAGEASHPGIFQSVTGSTTTGRSGVIANNTGGQCFKPSDLLECTWVIRIPTLSNATDRFTIYVGNSDMSGSTEPANGAYFLYSDNINSGKWQAKTALASTRTTVNDTGSAVAGATWYKLKAIINAAGTNVDFYVNDTLIGSSTTNIPTVAIGPTIMIIKSAGTASLAVDMDYVRIRQEFATSR